MELLLDTHAFLWWLADDRRLGRVARAKIAARENRVFVSAANAWEIAVKRAIGKLHAPGDIVEWITRSDFSALPIEVEHAVAAGELEPHHHDPFDRLLVAQARLERLTLVTTDRQLVSYGIAVLDAGA